MAEVYGTQEIKDLAKAVAGTVKAIEGVFADGKVDLKDLASLPAVFTAAKEFTTVEWSKLLPEFNDLSTEEVADLAVFFPSVFSLDNKTVEEIVKTGLGLVTRGVQIVKDVKYIAELVKSLAA